MWMNKDESKVNSSEPKHKDTKISPALLKKGLIKREKPLPKTKKGAPASEIAFKWATMSK